MPVAQVSVSAANTNPQNAPLLLPDLLGQ